MPAIFLDRDGVICENRSDYVKNWGEFLFLPGVKRSLAALAQLDFRIVIVTNQSVIGRGIAPASVIEDIHQRMTAEITGAGGRVDRVLYCPHRPDEGCACRKPHPGMLFQAAEGLNIDLAQSYMIGDAVTDLQAGQCANCLPILVLTGRGREQLNTALHSKCRRAVIARDLRQVTEYILSGML